MIKRFKVGNVQLKMDKSGVTVALGNPKAKNEQYRTTVEVIVKDNKGNVLAKTENGFLQVVDPRKATNKDGTPLSEDQLERIPAWVKNELYLVVSDDK